MAQTNSNLLGHPSPAKVYELAANHAMLLRTLFLHPKFKYLEPPDAIICKIDTEGTPSALLWLSDFVQNTYIKYIIPFLPAEATRKCKDTGNPWAYSDPNYQWEWQWDAEAGALKDLSGNTVEFPGCLMPKQRTILPI
ncbi:hypothetical protein F4778DRAFT_761521 [Xylariomycetidae sp. FL2044]|nr:hypothetical protein F4778DRAFT_761521 [Xylariomycetidae sp. FL2044]